MDADQDTTGTIDAVASDDASDACPGVRGAPSNGEVKLVASDGAELDRFGYSVAISGNTAIVTSVDKRAAYVYGFNGSAWVQQAELTSGDYANDGFGSSVAISGNTAIVGALYTSIGSNAYQGAAYVYGLNGSTWVQQAKLTASDGASRDGFGWSVAISGNTAIVGAYQRNPSAAYVYLFDGTTWVQQAELTASDGAYGNDFGWSVGLSVNTAIVGACAGCGAVGPSLGAAYVYGFNGSTWTQQAELTASDSDDFGDSVAISGNTAIVGAQFTNIGFNVYQGAAYVYGLNGTTWVQQAKLTGSDGAAQDFFGSSVALSGNTAIVAATGKNSGLQYNQGAAYSYVLNGSGWTQQTKLTASDGERADWFGNSVALSGGSAIVGAFQKSKCAIPAQGAAYLYTVP